MKIGIFDSGAGGLIIAHSIINKLPEYDYLYLGDTARVPYGSRSQELIYQFTFEAVEYLFKNDCELIIIACNTASSTALRQIQQEYLPLYYPDRQVLGVLIPAAERAVEETNNNHIGVLATQSTVNSKAFTREVKKIFPAMEVFEQAAPLLAPLIEYNGVKWAGPVLDEYLAPLRAAGIDCLILGCTHYPFLKETIREKLGSSVEVISQDEIIPEKLKDYLNRHPEIEEKLSKSKGREFHVTDLTDNIELLANKLFNGRVELQLISYTEAKKKTSSTIFNN